MFSHHFPCFPTIFPCFPTIFPCFPTIFLCFPTIPPWFSADPRRSELDERFMESRRRRILREHQQLLGRPSGTWWSQIQSDRWILLVGGWISMEYLWNIYDVMIWLVVTGTFLYIFQSFPDILGMEFHHPNWRTLIFFRGVQTTNQIRWNRWNRYLGIVTGEFLGKASPFMAWLLLIQVSEWL